MLFRCTKILADEFNGNLIVIIAEKADNGANEITMWN